MDNDFQQIKDIFEKKKTLKAVKPPTYEWQDLALRVIKELGIPNFKRSAVFKVCKENPKPVLITALNDTKELCQTGLKWKYFFKILESPKNKNGTGIPVPKK